MKPAAVKVTAVNGNTNRMSLKAGAEGTGKTLWSCQYWPDSAKSTEQAYGMLDDAALRNNVEIVASDLATAK